MITFGIIMLVALICFVIGYKNGVDSQIDYVEDMEMELKKVKKEVDDFFNNY